MSVHVSLSFDRVLTPIDGMTSAKTKPMNQIAAITTTQTPHPRTVLLWAWRLLPMIRP
jgi:hypothetical protein